MPASSRLRLTDLPRSLQTYIIQFIHTPGDSLSRTSPSTPLSLAHLSDHYLTRPLPRTLLHVALSCRTLASAVAELLRKEATFLAANNTGLEVFPGWVIALSQHAKALSTRDYVMDTAGIDGVAPPAHLSEESKCHYTHRLFRCLRKSNIVLQVLDIANLPLHKIQAGREELVADLTCILSTAAHQLRELSVSMDSIVADALQHVAMPVLHTLELMGHIFDDEESLDVGSTCTAAHMLRTADDALQKGGGALTVLNLGLIQDVPLFEPHEQLAMWRTVETLRVDGSFSIADQGDAQMDALVDFMALFSNLRCVSWDGDLTEARISRIVASCPLLERMSLNPIYVYTEDPGDDSLSEDERDVDSLSRIFMACQGKLVSLKLRGFMSAEVWGVLGRYNPNLESVTTQISTESAYALIPLLGTHCRNVKEVELRVLKAEPSLGYFGWGMFQKAVESASEELQVIHVRHEALESDVEPTINAIACIMEAMGKRAKDFSFEVPLDTRDFKPLVQGLVHIARTAARYNENLEILYLDFTAADGFADYEWWVDEDSKRDYWKELLIAERDLKRRVPSLKSLQLSLLDDTAREFFISIDEQVE